MKRLFFALVLLTGFFAMVIKANAQRITYSQPEKDDSRNTEFEIIGKVGNHILVYKNNQGDAAVSIYDNNMNPVDRVPLTLFRKERLLSVDFVSYPDKFIMIYQFHHRQYIYCYGAIFNENSKLLADPILIDSTNVGGGSVKDRLYSVVHSDDKSRILVYKINRNKDLTNIFYTFQFDNNLNLINNSRIPLLMERRQYLSNFLLSNNGDFIFDKAERSAAKDFLDQAWIVAKPLHLDTFYVSSLNLKNQYLDELKIRLDNKNQQAYLVSFYYKQKRSDVAGLYFMRYDFGTHKIEDQNMLSFSDQLKANAENSGSSHRSAFDDYFLRQLIVRSDGGFLITAESFYSNSQYSPFDSWNNYMYSPYGYSPYAYYSPFSPWYYSPFGRNNNGTRFHYNDIAILSYDSTGHLEWSNFVRKEQYDDETDDFLSYQMVNIGSELHFLYNDPYRRSYILTDESITPDGKLTREPTFRNLDKGYVWMPRYGKQISARQVVIPCIYRNFVCFAKIDF